MTAHMRKHVDGTLDAKAIALLTRLYGEPNEDGVFTGKDKEGSEA